MSYDEHIGCDATEAWLRTDVAERRAEVARLRATLTKIRDVTGTSTEAHHFARNALEQQGSGT